MLCTPNTNFNTIHQPSKKPQTFEWVWPNTNSTRMKQNKKIPLGKPYPLQRIFAAVWNCSTTNYLFYVLGQLKSYKYDMFVNFNWIW